jgi:hypothetical protein
VNEEAMTRVGSQRYREKKISALDKTVPGKVATTRCRGWTQIEYQNKSYNINQKR